ncbi:K(+)-transporting ATPase subunit F [Actinomycetospora termitidis]|uniref:K(+)-transporting ATPase subunit F n=1 Tax=Actinomycetospora termitidis TaxID=3053470 RepID=A0ABT7MFS5_9PSEU|nr:K(+)-transporting ATPase subunit F [Actinomycetospora sp. Odt1-22]MDL5158732.1 K(+)-transporting ATPase subunit F [Actinomycetospora sp. Odt1-22]
MSATLGDVVGGIVALALLLYLVVSLLRPEWF